MAVKEVYKAQRIKEAVEILNEYKEGCRVIAGGTDLIIDLRNKKISPEMLVDISGIDEMKNITVKEDYIEIGAAVNFSDIEECSLFNSRLLGLKKAAASIGSPQIRNRATVGGNICNGSPAADMVPPLVALGAKAVLKSLEGERETTLEELYRDKGGLDIKPQELLTAVRFKRLEEREALGFGKMGLRNALAISRVCFGVYVKLDKAKSCSEIRIASGAIGKHAVREIAVEDFIRGRFIDNAIIEEAAEVLKEQIKLRLSGRPTVEFKSQASKGVIKETLSKCMEMLTEV